MTNGLEAQTSQRTLRINEDFGENSDWRQRNFTYDLQYEEALTVNTHAQELEEVRGEIVDGPEQSAMLEVCYLIKN